MSDLRFGLSPETIAKINDVFKMNPHIDQVLIYGSRAKGNFKHGSDIDLVIISDELSPSDLSKIETALDDLLLPYSIDLSLFSMLDDSSLIDHIKRVGKPFFVR